MSGKDLIAAAKAHGTPLIDGNQVTFVWHGKYPPELIGDFTEWRDDRPVRLQKVTAQVWSATLEFQPGAYVEYAFVTGDQHTPDPHNPRRVSNGMGAYNNYFYLPPGQPTPLASLVSGVPRGLVTRHNLETSELAAGHSRTVYLYQPPVADPVPLLVVLDGRDYLRRASLANIVDNLIHQGRIRPLAMALVNNGGHARMVEYACSEATLLFLEQPVIELAREQLNLTDIEAEPGSWGIMGASMGGLMAFYTGLRLPLIFGRVLSQSGAFTIYGQDMVVYPMVSAGHARPGKFWLDVGRLEALLETNRRLHALLQARGYDVTYREHNAGHNYSAWRDDLPYGLETLFHG